MPVYTMTCEYMSLEDEVLYVFTLNFFIDEELIEMSEAIESERA